MCLGSKSQFWYTMIFLLLPLVFYTTEFLTLRPEYEPTGESKKTVSHKNSKNSDARRPKPVGLRSKLISLWRDLRRKGQSASQYLSGGLSLAAYFVATVVALILWQPVTACCKFYRDSRYTRTDIDPNAHRK